MSYIFHFDIPIVHPDFQAISVVRIEVLQAQTLDDAHLLLPEQILMKL